MDPVRRQYFPPPLGLLLSWSTLFRSGGTLRNYLGYVRTACLLENVSVEVGVLWALSGVSIIKGFRRCSGSPHWRKQRSLWTRPKISAVERKCLFAGKCCDAVVTVVTLAYCISRRMVEEILVWCKAHVEWRRHGLLFLFAYSFLLRVPSEALPVVAGPENYEGPSNAWLFREGADKLVLRLRRRKNKPGGSRLVRKCCCSKSKASCVVCLVGPLLDIAQPGQSLFKNISAQGEWHSVMPAVPVVRVRASRRR